MAPAFRLVEIASWPSFAPTTLERSSSSSNEREPIRIVAARFSASSKLPMPSIRHCPPVIGSFTFGAEIGWPSYTI